MTVLLDTHFLIWIVLSARRLRDFPWLDRYRPWGLSPVSLLEVQFLSEAGRLEVRNPEFTDAVLADPRFLVDEVPWLTLVRHALPLTWTRDPFDRLLAAHSRARRVPLCTLDETLQARHEWILKEVRLPRRG
ncbi:MAG: PIN domain-containing protein [Armatimonadota bacterium]|nr:PIN domain-containing protein [Armatimonadota bacterium]